MKEPVVITRNGVEKELSSTVFGKLSPNAGKKFYTPVLSPANAEKDTAWVGVSDLFDIANRVLRRTFADIYLDEDNRNPDGTINEENLLQDYADFTAGMAKLTDLEDQIDELQQQQQALAIDPNFVLEDPANPTKEYAEIAEQMKKIALTIKPLRAKKASIEAKYQVRADKRKAAKAAKEAAAKAAGTAVPA